MFRRAAIVLLFSVASISWAAEWALAGEIETENDVEYSNPADQHLKLTLSRPKQIDNPAPAVVFIHGGGWAGGNRGRWTKACEEMARRGFVAVTVSYRFAPDFPFPAAVEDVQSAVRWLRNNVDRLKIDPNRIGAAGDSAGGHLSQCLGVGMEVGAPAGAPSSRVQCVVNIYGPNDMTRERASNKQVAQLLVNFLGDPVDARRRYILASPYYWVTPEAAPTLIIHGTKDNVVPYDQAAVMLARLKGADVDAELLTMEGAGHGFQGADAERCDAAMYAWLESHLMPKK